MFRVTGKPNNFHSILQRHRDVGQRVGGGDKKDFRKVIINVQVMITECAILLRIEDFKESSRRVSSKISAHLIHFVETEDRVVHPCFF